MRTIQPKVLEIPGVKMKGKENCPGKTFRKFGYTSQGCPLFWKFWKTLFHLLLEVAGNPSWTFSLNGKRPTFPLCLTRLHWRRNWCNQHLNLWSFQNSKHYRIVTWLLMNRKWTRLLTTNRPTKYINETRHPQCNANLTTNCLHCRKPTRSTFDATTDWGVVFRSHPSCMDYQNYTNPTYLCGP